MKKLRFSLLITLIFSVLAIQSALPMDPPSTPKKRKASSSPVKQRTPKKLKIDVRNYCRNIITALNADDLDTVHDELHDFYEKIPYGMHIQDVKFYMALSYCLCHSMTPEKPAYLTKNDFLQEDMTYTALTTGKNAYVFQFRTVDTKSLNQPAPLCTYNIQDKDVTVIAITFLLGDTRAKLCVNIIDNNGPYNIHVTPKEYEYNSENFYTNIIDTLHNASDNADAYRKHSLSIFYNDIPEEYRLENEKFYQSMLFCCVTLFRSCFADAEKQTANGRMDIALAGEICNSIIEFKFKRCIKEAFDQIEDRKYSSYFNDERKSILHIGIDIDLDSQNNIVVTTGSKLYVPQHRGGMKKATVYGS